METQGNIFRAITDFISDVSVQNHFCCQSKHPREGYGSSLYGLREENKAFSSSCLPRLEFRTSAYWKLVLTASADSTELFWSLMQFFLFFLNTGLLPNRITLALILEKPPWRMSMQCMVWRCMCQPPVIPDWSSSLLSGELHFHRISMEIHVLFYFWTNIKLPMFHVSSCFPNANVVLIIAQNMWSWAVSQVWKIYLFILWNKIVRGFSKINTNFLGGGA